MTLSAHNPKVFVRAGSHSWVLVELEVQVSELPALGVDNRWQAEPLVVEVGQPPPAS